MNTKFVRITRRSKVGLGFSPHIDRPYYTGTIKQVIKQSAEDNYFQSLAGKCDIAWFVKQNRRWYKVDPSWLVYPADLVIDYDDKPASEFVMIQIIIGD